MITGYHSRNGSRRGVGCCGARLRRRESILATARVKVGGLGRGPGRGRRHGRGQGRGRAWRTLLATSSGAKYLKRRGSSKSALDDVTGNIRQALRRERARGRGHGGGRRRGRRSGGRGRHREGCSSLAAAAAARTAVASSRRTEGREKKTPCSMEMLCSDSWRRMRGWGGRGR